MLNQGLLYLEFDSKIKLGDITSEQSKKSGRFIV